MLFYNLIAKLVLFYLLSNILTVILQFIGSFSSILVLIRSFYGFATELQYIYYYLCTKLLVMEIILSSLESIWDMLNEMSPYLLLGFLIAGLMHAFIPGSMFSRYLSGKSFRSVTNAALFGIPLPLCSCGVIPTAMSLRREGASKGAAVSFLIATPQTGVDSILATYSLLGLPFAIIRPIAALFTALFGGQMVNMTDTDSDAEKNVKAEHSRELNPTFTGKMREALKYAFGEMMEDIGKWLVIGIVIAGLISLIPDDFFAIFKGNTLASILLVLCLSIPMYLCATGSIPIAVALILKGLTPGAALVMLMAGPASNMASIMVIGKVLGRRTLITYLASIVSGAIAFALLIDFALPASWFVPKMMMGGACCHESHSWFAIACNILLILLLIRALFFHHHDHCHCGCEDHHHEHHHDSESCCCHEGHSCSCDDDDDDCQVITFQINGMHCNHCSANAQKALASVEGVEKATVDLASKTARVEGTASFEDLKAAVESLGYTVQE